MGTLESEKHKKICNIDLKDATFEKNNATRNKYPLCNTAYKFNQKHFKFDQFN